eukprot:scaffold172435_cov37-Tisochrysis_lutea.AAC.3
MGSAELPEARRRCCSASWLGLQPSARIASISRRARSNRSCAGLRETTPSAAVYANHRPPSHCRARSTSGERRSSLRRSPTARIAAACSAPRSECGAEGPAARTARLSAPST